MLFVGSDGRRGLTVSLVLSAAALVMTGCQSASSTHSEEAPIATDIKFDSKTFGVPASPRVTTLKNVRTGGGREQVGKPYRVHGRWYYPKEHPGHVVQTGRASWYGPNFHGRLTANGEVYNMYGLSAAHPTFPLPCYARVTNVENGSSVMVRVNDRGPYADGRIIDLSSEAAELLDYKDTGTTSVKVEYVGKAPLEGNDTQMLMASYEPGKAEQGRVPESVMVAMNDQPLRTPSYATALTEQHIPLPGVRPLEDLANGSPIGGAQGATAAVVAPIPTPRSLVSAYASTRAPSGAAGALAGLAAGTRNERIEIGLVGDDGLIDRIKAVTAGHGQLVEDRDAAAGNALSLAVEVAADQDTDRLLQDLWQAGATDAFVIRD